ncbi:MAG: PAS domain-containing sensor histidine kinase [Campylobacterales bacterium]|nr:PAS domain-containing sensor histidine kinase [Campylobacterales bacterium]
MPIDTLTLKEQLKERLRSNNPEYRYYKTIFNTISDMIAVTDGEGVFDANIPFLNFFAPVMGENLESFRFWELFEKIEKFGYVYDGYQNKRWFETILEGTKKHYTIGVQMGGVLHTFNISLSPLDASNAIYIATLTNVTDIMCYKTTLEEGIKSSVEDRDKTHFLLAQYDKAIEAATLVFKCDLRGTITYANRALSEMMLYGKGELVGIHFSVLRGKSMSHESYRHIWKRVQSGKIYKGTLEIEDKLGGSHYLDVSFIPIQDHEKKIVEFFSLSHEITEVVEAKKMAVKTLKDKNKFFDQVSHELRTPLNAIINFTDSALESFDEIIDDAESRELVRMYIERSHKNSLHLLQLINSLLDMAKLRAGKEQYLMDSTEVITLVREVYESTSALNTKEALEYLLEVPPTAVYIQSDELRLRQIITNLISNAIKFTEWGFVRLYVHTVADECWIEVDDSGIGIPENKLDHIFEPFEQVGVHDMGTGLGLGIVSEYAKGMGMTLKVTSVFGEGSCFTLKIPILKTEGESVEWKK